MRAAPVQSAGTYHLYQMWLEAVTVCCRGTKEPIPLSQERLCWATDVAQNFLRDQAEARFHLKADAFLPLLYTAFFTPLQDFPECVPLINSLHRNPHFIVCFYGN